MPTLNDILVLLPEFYLVAVACLLLLMDAFMKPEQRGLLHWISIVVLLVAIYLVIVCAIPRPANGRRSEFECFHPDSNQVSSPIRES